MKDIDEQVAVKQGHWFYGGLTLCPVRLALMGGGNTAAWQ